MTDPRFCKRQLVPRPGHVSLSDATPCDLTRPLYTTWSALVQPDCNYLIGQRACYVKMAAPSAPPRPVFSFRHVLCAFPRFLCLLRVLVAGRHSFLFARGMTLSLHHHRPLFDTRQNGFFMASFSFVLRL
jgi:hypothetical protein